MKLIRLYEKALMELKELIIIWQKPSFPYSKNMSIASLACHLEKITYNCFQEPNFLSRFFSNILCAFVNSSNFQYKLMNPLSRFQVPSPLWNYRGMSATFYSFHFLKLQNKKIVFPCPPLMWFEWLSYSSNPSFSFQGNYPHLKSPNLGNLEGVGRCSTYFKWD